MPGSSSRRQVYCLGCVATVFLMLLAQVYFSTGSAHQEVSAVQSRLSTALEQQHAVDSAVASTTESLKRMETIGAGMATDLATLQHSVAELRAQLSDERERNAQLSAALETMSTRVTDVEDGVRNTEPTARSLVAETLSDVEDSVARQLATLQLDLQQELADNVQQLVERLEAAEGKAEQASASAVEAAATAEAYVRTAEQHAKEWAQGAAGDTAATKPASRKHAGKSPSATRPKRGASTTKQPAAAAPAADDDGRPNRSWPAAPEGVTEQPPSALQREKEAPGGGDRVDEPPPRDLPNTDGVLPAPLHAGAAPAHFVAPPQTGANDAGDGVEDFQPRMPVGLGAGDTDVADDGNLDDAGDAADDGADGEGEAEARLRGARRDD